MFFYSAKINIKIDGYLPKGVFYFISSQNMSCSFCAFLQELLSSQRVKIFFSENRDCHSRHDYSDAENILADFVLIISIYTLKLWNMGLSIGKLIVITFV